MTIQRPRPAAASLPGVKGPAPQLDRKGYRDGGRRCKQQESHKYPSSCSRHKLLPNWVTLGVVVTAALAIAVG